MDFRAFWSRRQAHLGGIRSVRGPRLAILLACCSGLEVETPGSDVDVVCFTRRDGKQAGL